MPIAPPSIDFSKLALELSGELKWDDINRALYASSASIVEIWPQAVLTPKNEQDVVKALRFCAEHKLPVTCRGAGSGVVGQSLGQGLIIDFSVHMNRIVEVNVDEGWVHFQPGAVKDDVDSELATFGFFWPPDPSSSPWCTVGAMVANNSGGAKSVKYGTARDYLLELDLLNYEGERFKLRPIEIAWDGGLLFADDASETEKRLAQHAYASVRENRELLREQEPKSSRCSSGYNLFQLLPLEGKLPGEEGFDQTTPKPENLPLPDKTETGANAIGSPWILDMPRLFCGSEGSLGVLLSAKVRVTKVPRSVAGAALMFASDAKMAEGVVALLAQTKPAKLELLDRTYIDVAAKAEPELGQGIPDKLKTMLIVEYFGDNDADVSRQVDEGIAAVSEGDKSLAFDTIAAYDPTELDRLWRIRKIASPILSRVKGDFRPTRWIEDVAVPPWNLPKFIAGIKRAFTDNGFEGALFGHAGEGNLHVNPKANVKDAETRERMRACASRVYKLAKSLGGVISGEHGDGTMRAPYLRSMFGDAYELMLEIKREWDPHWLMNPLTKMLRPEDEEKRDTVSDLRMGEGYARHETGTGLDRAHILEEIEKCHGCGKCRTYCPIMSVGKEERFTARAKANLLRAVVSGKLDAKSFLVDPTFKENIDLCINCGQCLTDCPTHVDIPGIAIAFREQYTQRVKAPALSGMLGAPDRIGKMASFAPGVSKGMLKSRFLRGMAQKALGLDERRYLPEYKKERGLQAKSRLHVAEDVDVPKEIVLFPGCWANYNDPDGEKNAAIRIFEALGCRVHQPKLKCCGISKITQGDTETAARDWRENIELLLPFVERGAKIVFSAPSCLLASQHDMPRILSNPKAQQVADACVDIHQLLRTIFEHPRLRNQLKGTSLKGKKLAYHQPCHSKVSAVGDEPLRLVSLIPQGNVVDLKAGCCGLSGTFGLKTTNFDMSMQVGMKLFNRVNTVDPEIVFTPCGVCQTQIMQGNPDRKVMHPLKLLYDALP